MKLKKLLVVSGILFGLSCIAGAQNQLVTYPAPQEAKQKHDFIIKVREPEK